MPFSQFFRALQILFFALLAGQILICFVFLFLMESGSQIPSFQVGSWLPGVTVISLLLLGAAMFIRKKSTDWAKEKTSLKEKLGAYRGAQVSGWAITEAATLINGVCFFLSGKIEFLYIAGAVIAFFFTQMPLKNKLINELDLDFNDQNLLDDPNADVADPPKGRR